MKLTLLCLLVLTLCGCEHYPSGLEGQKAIENVLRFSSATNCLTVVSFQPRTCQRGQVKNDNGLFVQSYSQDFFCTIRSERRCILLASSPGVVLTVEADSPEFNSLSSLGYTILPANGVTTLRGTVIFERTESGWRPLDIKLNKS